MQKCILIVLLLYICCSSLYAEEPSKITTTAIQYRGVRYRYGGLSSRGIDCSGLVVRAALADNKKVPHHAASLFKLGKHIHVTKLQSGDLIFFGRGRRVSHVGIYIGDSKFIHASSSRGVVVDYLWKKYYVKRYKGARRLT